MKRNRIPLVSGLLWVLGACNNPADISPLTAPECTFSTIAASGDYLPASQNPPGGLAVAQAPMFVAIGFDDNGYSGIEGSGGSGGMQWAVDYFNTRSNPVGSGNPATFDGAPCRASFYFTSIYVAETVYESPVWVKRSWNRAIVAGHEAGNHTHRHDHGQAFSVAQWEAELTTCNTWLSKPFDPNEAVNSPDGSKGPGAPAAGIRGFRTPFLEYGPATFSALRSLGFTYDCSIEEGWQGSHDGTNFMWPYTLDYGSPGNDALVAQGLKQSIGTHPGLWEMGCHPFVVPPDNRCAEYGIGYSLRNKVKQKISWFDLSSGKITGLDYTIFVQAAMTKAEALATLKYTLDLRIAGNRAPFMLGCHTDEYSTKYGYAPNTTARERQQVIEEFVEYALSKSFVRVVPLRDIVSWMRNPVAIDGGTVHYTITASVKPQTVGGTGCTDPAWSASAIYTQGTVVSYTGRRWRARWWTQNTVPGSEGQWGVWEDLGECGGSQIVYYGTISPSGSVSVASGAAQSFVLTPEPGCRVRSLTVDGENRGALSGYTFSSVNAPHTIVAEFEPGTIEAFTINASAGANGSITPSGAVVVNRGESRSFSIVAAAGYVIADVVVNGVSQGTPGSYTFVNVQSDGTIAATFRSSPVQTFTINASAGANGSITPSGAVVVNKGASKSFSIVAAAGYVIADVAVNGVSQGTPGSYTFADVQSDGTIAATFKVQGTSPCAGIVAWDASTPWTAYRVGDRRTNSARLWECVNVAYSFYEPSGSYGHFGWKLVGACN